MFSSICMLSFRSELIIPGGILPIIRFKVMFFFNDGWKNCMTQGFLILMYERSMTLKHELVAKPIASSFNPYSSETSLFLEKLILWIPLFLANYFENSMKPWSWKKFLLMSKTFKVLFISKKPARFYRPRLLILLKLKQSSSSVWFVFKASANSIIPPSFMKF